MECFNPYSKTTSCSNKFGCEVYLETSKRDDQLEPEKRLIRRLGHLRLLDLDQEGCFGHRYTVYHIPLKGVLRSMNELHYDEVTV